MPAACRLVARHREHDGQSRAAEDQLGELLVHAERARHADGELRERLRRLGHHARDVARGVLARREHVGKDDELRRPRLHAAPHAGRDGRLGELHVRVAHDDLGAGHRLHEIRHAVHHLVGRVALRAVVDQQDGLHASPRVRGWSTFKLSRELDGRMTLTTHHVPPSHHACVTETAPSGPGVRFRAPHDDPRCNSSAPPSAP